MLKTLREATRKELIYGTCIGIILSSYILTFILSLFASGFGYMGTAVNGLLFDINVTVTVVNLFIMSVNYIWGKK